MGMSDPPQADYSLPTSRHAKARRLLLGLSPYRAACLAGIPQDTVSAFERGDIEDVNWRPVSQRLHGVYQTLGGGWRDASLHEGAHSVYLREIVADNRRAINAALALMGHTVGTRRRAVTIALLAARVERRAGIPASHVRRALGASAGSSLSALIAIECFHQLRAARGGAGCWFTDADGGWREVGCDHNGCWW